MFLLILSASLIIEQIVEQVKRIINNGKPNWYALGASGLGIAVAVFGGLSLYEAAGIEFSIPYFGEVMSGFLFGAGSGIIHDLIGALKNAKQNESGA
jgi:hypothetical protein